MTLNDGCGAPAQTAVATEEVGDQIVVAGKVTSSGTPAVGAYVRLLDADGEFAGEVQASDGGDFRFYAAPGSWTVRALHRDGRGQASVAATGPGLHEVAVPVA